MNCAIEGQDPEVGGAVQGDDLQLPCHVWWSYS